MEAQEFIDLLESPVKAKSKGIDELKKLAQQYPYSQPIQLLYAIRLRKSSEHLFHQQLGKASILTNNREVLFNLFEQEQESLDLVPKQVEDDLLEKPTRVTERKADVDKNKELEPEVEDEDITSAEEETQDNDDEAIVRLKPIEPFKVENSEERKEDREKEEEHIEDEQPTDQDEQEIEESGESESRKERDLSSLSADERIKAILERNRKLREDFESKKQKGEAPLSDIDERLNKIKERLSALKRTPNEQETRLDESAKIEAPETKEPETESTTVKESIGEVVQAAAEHVQDQIEAAEEVDHVEQLAEEKGIVGEEATQQDEREEPSQMESNEETERDTASTHALVEEKDEAEWPEENVLDEDVAEQSETLALNEQAETDMTKVLVVEEDEGETELNSPVEAKEEAETVEQHFDKIESASEESVVSPNNEEEIEEEVNLEADALVEAHEEEDADYAPAFIIGDEEDEAVEDQKTLNEPDEEEAQKSEEQRKSFVLESTETDAAGETNIEQTKEQMSFSEWLTYLNKQSRGAKNLNVSTAQAAIEETSFEDKVQLLDSFVEKLPSLKKKVSPGPKSTPIEIGNLVNQGNDRLVTETLAKVYIEQKHYKKAIKAYQILKLKYPEKSSFFASQISEIKKLKDFK